MFCECRDYATALVWSDWLRLFGGPVGQSPRSGWFHRVCGSSRLRQNHNSPRCGRKHVQGAAGVLTGQTDHCSGSDKENEWYEWYEWYWTFEFWGTHGVLYLWTKPFLCHFSSDRRTCLFIFSNPELCIYISYWVCLRDGRARNWQHEYHSVVFCGSSTSNHTPVCFLPVFMEEKLSERIFIIGLISIEWHQWMSLNKLIPISQNFPHANCRSRWWTFWVISLTSWEMPTWAAWRVQWVQVAWRGSDKPLMNMSQRWDVQDFLKYFEVYFVVVLLWFY